MPMSTDFENRLYPRLDAIAAHFGTPFHIYDEAGIRQTGQDTDGCFQQYFRFPRIFCCESIAQPENTADYAFDGIRL